MTEPASPHALFADITPNRANGTLYARLIGPSIGQRETPILKDMLTQAIDGYGAGLKNLVLDVTAITFMNSGGLGMLVECRTRAATHKAKVILFGVSPQLKDLLKMVKFDRLFAMAGNADELAKTLAK
jgi:anti-sigma B factor antagonist